jgi:hypothetical protein
LAVSLHEELKTPQKNLIKSQKIRSVRYSSNNSLYPGRYVAFFFSVLKCPFLAASHSHWVSHPPPLFVLLKQAILYPVLLAPGFALVYSILAPDQELSGAQQPITPPLGPEKGALQKKRTGFDVVGWFLGGKKSTKDAYLFLHFFGLWAVGCF